jgi:hypothetical protein
MYYIYRHIRLDTNEVFYIGKGTISTKANNTFESEHSRAFVKSSTGRSPYWKRIATKHGFKVDIIFYSDSEDIIYKKEQEFIAIYGRKDLKKGTLVNFTDGGTNVIGTFSLQRKKEWYDSLSNKKRIYQYSQDGKFVDTYPSLNNALKKLNSTSVCALSLAIKKDVPFLNHKWFYTYQGESIKPFITHWKQVSKKITINNEIEILTFKSIKETARFLNTSASFIRREINKPNRKVKGYSVSN